MPRTDLLFLIRYWYCAVALSWISLLPQPASGFHSPKVLFMLCPLQRMRDWWCWRGCSGSSAVQPNRPAYPVSQVSKWLHNSWVYLSAHATRCSSISLSLDWTRTDVWFSKIPETSHVLLLYLPITHACAHYSSLSPVLQLHSSTRPSSHFLLAVHRASLQIFWNISGNLYLI